MGVVGRSLGGHEARTRRAMFVRTSRHRSGSSWTSPTCAHGGGRASTRVAGGDVENALFIFGRADTAAVGCPSDSAQRQSYLVPPPTSIRSHSSSPRTRVYDRCPSPSHPPRASARPSPSAAMLPPAAAPPASRYAPPSTHQSSSRDVEPTRSSMHIDAQLCPQRPSTLTPPLSPHQPRYPSTHRHPSSRRTP